MYFYIHWYMTLGILESLQFWGPNANTLREVPPVNPQVGGHTESSPTPFLRTMGLRLFIKAKPSIFQTETTLATKTIVNPAIFLIIPPCHITSEMEPTVLFKLIVIHNVIHPICNTPSKWYIVIIISHRSAMQALSLM